MLFCPGNLESAHILGPGIWNHRNYHHRNNCYKLGSIALICPSARSVRVHIFTEINILYGIGERQNVEATIELEMTCVLYKTVTGCDYLEQVSDLCQLCVFSLCYPLGCISL